MGSLTPLLFIGLVMMCIGELFHIIGLATPAWIEQGNTIHGLWEACDDDGDNCVDIEYKGDMDDDADAVKAMVLLGMIFGLVGAVLAVVIVVFQFALKKTTPTLMLVAQLVVSIVAFIFIIIGVIIYEEEINGGDLDHGYSFILTVFGACLMPVAGVLVFLGGKS